MFANLPLDNKEFLSGCESVLKEAGFSDWMSKQVTAGGGGFRDKLWNKGTDTFGKFVAQSGDAAMKHGLGNTISQAGNQAGAGAVNGVTTQIGNKFTDMANGVKSYGSGMLNDPLKTMKESPWMTGALGAGVAGAGYLGGKALGLWGDSAPGSAPNPQAGQAPPPPPTHGVGSPPPMMQSAYTPGYTPMALSKAGNEVSLPAPLMTRFGPSMALGSGMYNLINRRNDEQEETPHQININPDNARVNKLLRNPKMRNYITSLVNTTHT